MSANERKHVRTHSTRGFVAAPDHEGRKGLYVRKGWHLEACPGEAHSPEVGGMIDNCMLCAPLWGCIAVADVVDDATANAVADEHLGPPLVGPLTPHARHYDIAAMQRAAELLWLGGESEAAMTCLRCARFLRGAE